MTKNSLNDTLQKCLFIMNALDNGWKVKKRKGSYIFSKKHEGRKEIFKEGYLESFLVENMKPSSVLQN
jgi:hypothetical protein